jgi:hypothetical protein
MPTSNLLSSYGTASTVIASNRIRFVISLLFGTFLLFATASWAQYGPFAELPGNWNGEGKIVFEDGKHERIACKALYVVGADGNELQQNLRCAGSFPIDLKSNVTCRGGSLSGTWSEANSNASGEVQGRAGGGHFEMNVHTDDFDATLVLTTYGNVQSVRISSNKQMKMISIRLVRSELQN